MKTFNQVLIGEFKRLFKYNIIQVSFGVSVLWLLVLFLIGKEAAGPFIGLFIFMDITMMTVLLMGVSLFYERQENTLKTMLVTPASLTSLIASKILSALYLAIQSGLILALFGKFFFDISIAFFPLMAFILIIALAHGAIGFVMSLYSNDFNGLLAFLIVYMVILAFPSIFYAFELIPSSLETLLIVSPTHASFILIESSTGADKPLWEIMVAIAYLLILSGGLMKFVIFPNYASKGVKE
ncbi:MAG: ABC transporter permease [Bacillota bacterium]